MAGGPEATGTAAWHTWTLHYGVLGAVLGDVYPLIRAHGLEAKEFFLLAVVDEHPNPAALARALMLPKPSITFMVKRMEAASYLRRELDRGDLRRFHLSLTPSGRKAMESARAALEQAFEARLSRLSPTTRKAFARALEQMAESSEG